jgi:nitroimidazol reductase NimA-like FMN-containing flavoprotein (pyridoxamine 5'-phosphate oxidase superfamily)
VTTHRPEVAELALHECLRLLRTVTVGRLAIAADDHPEVFPINYVVDHGTVVFRTAPGTKLAALTANRNVTFEADAYDAAAGEAWSVVIKGSAVPIASIHEQFDAVDLPLFPWHTAPKPHVVRIEPVEVTGRRFRVGVPARRAARPRAADE